MSTFNSEAEQLAAAALELPAFHYVNLVGIRSDVTKLLSRIGSNVVFREYTKHDISHIDAMLKSLEWLVPEETKAFMTPADWLVITLSIYLHDLGLLVTDAEFSNRGATAYSSYVDDVSLGKRGEEYANKVSKMEKDQAEAFLYQEFVRENHAQRIRNWITQSTDTSLGGDPVVIQCVFDLLKDFEPRFRRDLGVLCESHHKEDLDDLSKYKTVQPYGNGASETANLQFAAILLRLSDLLHVTRDRTPSLSFRLINPTDPKSVTEWRKQMATVSVRPVAEKDKKGNVTSEQSKTIGFYAYFTEPDGFFALTGYIAYVRSELQKISDWLEIGQQQGGSNLRVPWERVDESNIEAEGFLKEEFGFSLDKDKILQLLTGHTLYNNANVVVRELVQNGIDAVRLDAYEQKSSITGKVNVTWSQKDRTLTVEDTGTGMTQRIIERHFLRAGSSRYQDPEFSKTFPNFSPISRFGIGVLSAFMVADEVEVITCSRNHGEKARKLSLRALLGRYLIREYERTSPDIPDAIREHGTRITLKLRAGAQMISVRRSAENWIVFPACPVQLQIDDGKPTQIGYPDAVTAIRDLLVKIGCSPTSDPTTGVQKYDVRSFQADGLSLAAAVEWSTTFKEWTFFNLARYGRQVDEDGAVATSMVGTCIEGIRIDNVTPGFRNVTFLAICNVTGKQAPHTNVARSEFEVTPEREALLSKIYGCYCKHVSTELSEMQAGRGFSPTWAARESAYLLGPLLVRGEGSNLASDQLMEQHISEVPAHLIERNGKRELISLRQLNEIPSFWSIDSSGVRSIEALLKELPKRLSLSTISNLGDEPLFSLPDEPVVPLSPYMNVLTEMMLQNREVSKLIGRPQERRLDILWSMSESKSHWLSLRTSDWKTRRYILARLNELNRQRSFRDLSVCRGGVEILGLEGIEAVKSIGATFILPDAKIAPPLTSLIERVEKGSLSPDLLVFATYMLSEVIGRQEKVTQPRDFMNRVINGFPGRGDEDLLRTEFMSEEFLNAIGASSWSIFDVSVWSRGEVGGNPQVPY